MRMVNSKMAFVDSPQSLSISQLHQPRMVNGEVFEFSALPFDTIRRVKAQLAETTRVPAHQQRLLLGTELLKELEEHGFVVCWSI